MSIINTIKILLKQAEQYRSENPDRKGGYVVIRFLPDGSHTAEWTLNLSTPEAWMPGCIAVPEDGGMFVSVGGDEYNGAEQWQTYIHSVVTTEPTEEKSSKPGNSNTTKKYFVYSPDHGFELFNTKSARDEYASGAIGDYLNDCWDDSVTQLVSGEIHEQATMTNKKERPPEEEIEDDFDKDGDYWSDEWEYRCNYTMQPIGDTAGLTHYVHHIGPDDVHGPMTEMAAMRMANDINKSVAQIREESTRAEFLPHSVALVKTAEQLGIEA